MVRDASLMDSGVLKLLKSEPQKTQHEEIEPDRRAELRPTEIVQTKLLSLMPDMPVPVSCLHTHRDTRRGHY